MQKFIFASKVLPGQTVNLMAGMRPDANEPFIATISKGSDEQVSGVLDCIPREECYFGPFPILTPCEDWSSLVGSFFSKFKVMGRLEQFSGSAMLQKYSSHYNDATKAVADMLGIEKKYADDSSYFGFVLARVPRNMPNAVVNLSDRELTAFKENLINVYDKKIKTFEDSLDKDSTGNVYHTPGNIQKSIALISEELGSHYVESVEIGDLAYQVFVYSKENYKLICDAMKKSGWENENALGFRYFTSSRYCEHVGNVKLLSGDPAFEAARELLSDTTYNVSESVFKVVLDEQVQEIAQSLNNVVCVGASLKPITNIRYSNNNDLKAVNTIYNAEPLLDNVAVQGCITRFGAKGAGPASVTGNINVDYSKLYKPFGQMETMSLLWSPYLSISQMYVSLDQVWKMPALNKTGVKHLIITADVIEINDDIDLSSVETVTFACRLFVAGKDGDVPTVRLSSTSWRPLRLYCGSMKGTCVFEESGDKHNHQLVFDSPAVSLIPSEIGVMYNEFFSGKFPVELFFETDIDTEAKWRRTALKSGMETLLLTSSIPLSPQAIMPEDLRQTAIEAWNCLKWINDSTRLVVEESSKTGVELPEDLALIFTHSVMLIRASANPNDTSNELFPQVPPLRYTVYQDTVNRLLDVAKEYGKQIDITSKAIADYNKEIQKSYVEAERDENIKKIAQFMIDQNRALAEHERDLTQAHDEIINNKKQTKVHLEQREVEIKAKYDYYVEKLKKAKEDMVNEIAKKKKEEQARTVIEVVFGTVEFFGGIATGVYTLKTLGDARDAERILKKLEAFMKFIEQMNKGIDLIEKLSEHRGAIMALNDSTPDDFVKPPTDMDWDIFLSDSEAHVRPAEEYVKAEVENYMAVARDLTTVSKELNAILDQKSRLNYDIWAEEVSKNVSKKQEERLNQLKLNMNNPEWRPDEDYLSDLGQFNAVLRQKQNTALIKLAEIVRLQDASMTYHYLSKPTIITQFDILSIQEGLASQALAAVQALETYPYPPTDLKAPIEIKVSNIPVAKLTDDMGVEIQVQMNQGLFDTLAHVRINSLDARIEGIATCSGNCHVQIETVGNPMHDRGFKRELLSYQMISREWHVVYDIQTDETIIGTEPAKEWGQYFTKPTPFQTYRISLPKTSENDGIKFDNQLTSITLRFMVEAAYSKAPKRMVLGTSNQNSTNVTTTDPSNYFSLLKGKSITDGWDVVSFVSVDKINNLWKQRWEKELQDSFQGNKMFIQNINVNHTLKAPGGLFIIVYNFNMNIGAPWITFDPGSDQSAVINIPIITGILTATTYDKNGNELGKETMTVETTAEKPVLIKTQAKLENLPGEVAKGTVYIDPAQDAFKLENVELDPQVNVGICNEIADYFKNQKLEPWIIGTIRFDTDIDFLKPTKFSFRTFSPPESHKNDWPAILGIFILTITENAPSYGMRGMWPEAVWPVTSEYDGTVFFSSSLLWDKEIIPAVKQQMSDADVLIDETREKYIQLKGTTNVCNLPVELKDGYERNYNIVTKYATVNFDLSKVTLKYNFSSLELACDTSWKSKFPYQVRTPIPDPCYPDVSLSVGWDDVTFNCSFDSFSYPNIDPNNFNVTFTAFSVTPTVTESHPSHSFLGLPLPQIKQAVIDNAKAAITNKISGLRLNLSPMPMFAVSNLLFPESKTIDPKYVYHTHDLLIVGSVVHDWEMPQGTKNKV
jgi:hypothetical protein